MARPDPRLLGKQVIVTNPHGTVWSGRLIALADDPSLVLEQADSTRVCLPQSFTVAEDTSPETHGMAWLHQCGHLNQGAWDDDAMCGGCRFSVERPEDVQAHYRLVVVPESFTVSR